MCTGRAKICRQKGTDGVLIMGGKGKTGVFLGVLGVALVIVLIVFTTGKDKQGGDVYGEIPMPKLVAISAVEIGQQNRYTELSGTLQAGEETQVSFEIGGVIAELLHRAGDQVRVGEIMARVDSTDYSVRLVQAESGLDKARVNHQQAGDNFARLEQLYSAGAISASDYEAAQHFLTVAESDLNQTQQAYDLLQGKLSLAAPVTGTVIARLAATGELVSPGTPIFRIGQLDPLKVILPVPDHEIALWRVGQDVTLTLYGKSRQGKVTRIIPVANQGTGTIGVEVSVANPGRDWFPGQVVVAGRATAAKTGLFVPAGAVINRGEDKPFLFVAVDGKAVKRPVTTGELFGNQLEILSGLDEGEQLVVKGAELLFDGDSIEQPGGNGP